MKHGAAASCNARLACGCDACRTATNAYQRQARKRRAVLLRSDPALVPHGLPSTYVNWGCRCEPCRLANAAALRSWKERVGYVYPKRVKSPT